MPLGLNTILGSVSGTVVTKVGPRPSWRVPTVLLLLLCSVPLLSAQAGSRCGGVIGKKNILKTVPSCKCFAFIDPEMHFCINL